MLDAMLSNGLDELDYRILKILEKEGRKSFAEIGRELNLSRTAVRDRVLALEEKGVIERFSVIINPRAVGLNHSGFFSRSNVCPSKLLEVADHLARDEHILSVNQMTGKSTLHVHAALRNTAHLESFLNNVIYALPGNQLCGLLLSF